MQVSTTLRKLREHNACEPRYIHLRDSLGSSWGDDDEIDIVKILETNGLSDALWIPETALCGEFIQRRYRLFAVACCQEVLHLMKDRRSRDAVRVAHLYAYGEATTKELAATWDAALYASRDATWASAWDAAWDAARAAARVAARAAAWAAARAAARVADRDAAWDAAWDAARALVVRDLITTKQFDTLTAPMRAAGIDFDALTGADRD